MKKFFKEFKEFAVKGNMIDMAIGVLIGGAFTTLVGAFTTNIVNPLVSLIPGFDALDNALKIVVKPETLDEVGDVATAEVAIKFGAFISAIITFLITALIIFLIVKAVNKARELEAKAKEKLEGPKEEAAPAEPTTKICPYCKSEIAIGATRCPHCTSELKE